MRSKRLLMLGFLLCLPAVSQGAILTFAFEGVVDNVGQDPLAPISIEPGDRLIYEYTFDTNPPYIGGGCYAGIGASITVGDDHFPVTPDPKGEQPVQLRVQTSNPGLLGVWTSVAFDVPDTHRTGNVAVMLTGRLRPGNDPAPWWPLLSPPDLSADFADARFSLNIWPEQYGGISYGVYGTVTRSYQVPEPTAAVLLALAGLIAAGKRRRS